MTVYRSAIKRNLLLILSYLYRPWKDAKNYINEIDYPEIKIKSYQLTSSWLTRLIILIRVPCPITIRCNVSKSRGSVGTGFSSFANAHLLMNTPILASWTMLSASPTFTSTVSKIEGITLPFEGAPAREDTEYCPRWNYSAEARDHQSCQSLWNPHLRSAVDVSLRYSK